MKRVHVKSSKWKPEKLNSKSCVFTNVTNFEHAAFIIYRTPDPTLKRKIFSLWCWKLACAQYCFAEVKTQLLKQSVVSIRSLAFNTMSSNGFSVKTKNDPDSRCTGIFFYSEFSLRVLSRVEIPNISIVSSVPGRSESVFLLIHLLTSSVTNKSFTIKTDVRFPLSWFFPKSTISIEYTRR